MNANRNHGLRTKIERVAAALEELAASEAVIQPLIEEPLDPRIPGWLPESANKTIWNTRTKLETEITRLDLKLEKAIANRNGAANGNRAANGANGPTYPELTDAELSTLETEIEYLMKDVEVLQRDDCPAFTQVEFKNAVKAGNADVVHLLLRSPTIDPSANNNYAIRIASKHGHVNIVKVLLADARVDPSANNNYAIRLASANGHLNVVKVLLADPRVDPSAGDNYAIRMASANGHLNVVKLLLADPRVDPSADDNYAICFASINGRADVVKILLADRRVDPSANDNEAIHAASFNGHADVVKLLLADPRVDPSAHDNYAIYASSRNGHLNVVKLLLERREVVAKGLSRAHIDEAKPEEIRELLRAKFNAVGGRRRATRRATRTRR